MDAAREIAKQLRLRDIGGIILIDFIDMHEHEHQQMVLDALKQSLKKDRTKTIVVGMTGLGLIEMTRKKVRQELSSVLQTDCPYCDGTGKIRSPEAIARNVEKELGKYFGQTVAKAVQVEVHPSVAHVLKTDANGSFTRLQEAYGKKILFKPSEEMKQEEMKFRDIDSSTLVC
jgi:ribonuclease G